MIIRKTQQPSDYPSNSISNAKTTGTTNTYSCDYINSLDEKILDIYSTSEQIVGKDENGKNVY